MKILTINCIDQLYSTGKLIRSIEQYTRDKGCEYYHCYEEGEKRFDGGSYRIAGRFEHRINLLEARIIGLQYGVGTLPTIRLCKRIKKYKPDIVHIHCPNARSVNLYLLLDFLKKMRFKTIITNHAEYFYTGSCAHAFDCTGYQYGCVKCKDYKRLTGSLFFNRTAYEWRRMKEAMEGFEDLTMVAVSPWAEARIKSSVIAKDKHTLTIQNGIDTDNIFFYQPNRSLQDKYKNQKVLLHVTSDFSDDPQNSKGGYFMLQLAQSLTNVRILVIGPYRLKNNMIPTNIEFVGVVKNQSLLAQYYSLADLLIMTSKRETYGLTCAESLSCGTPVVGFENGGSETIALKDFSEFVKFADIYNLEQVIRKWIGKKAEEQDRIESAAKEAYSDKRMALEYYKLYKLVLVRQ